MSLPAPPSDSRFRIVLLEDDNEVASNLVALLDQAGFSCRHAEDADFVGWVEANPHLVIMEYQSIGIDAHAICREIRADQTGAAFGVPILILGPMDEVTEVNSLKAGADDYLPTPLKPSVVLARVVAHLRRAYRYNGLAGATTAASPTPATVPAGKTAREAALPDSIGGIPLWQEKDDLVLPAGWAECTLCGQRGPSELFETEDTLGNNIVQCPNLKCRSTEHVMFSLD